MEIYLNIRNIAKKKNIQQKALAASLNVTVQTMTNYFNGRTKITADQIPMFAKLLRVDIEDLFLKDWKPGINEAKYDETKSEMKDLLREKEKENITLKKQLSDTKNKLTECQNNLVKTQDKYIQLLEQSRNLGKKCG